MSFKKITESDSNYNNLELKSTKELVNIINDEDMTVASETKRRVTNEFLHCSELPSTVFTSSYTG